MSPKRSETAPRIGEARTNVLCAAVQNLRLPLDPNESPRLIGQVNNLGWSLPPANIFVSRLPVDVHQVTYLESKSLKCHSALRPVRPL